MRRHQLEHLVHAAAEITGECEIVVIGSQAILGSFPDAPAPLLMSMEADLFPLSAPDKADAIDGALGDGSPFFQTHGFYAHGVGPETPKAPTGWNARLVRVPVRPRPASRIEATALCLEPHDLVLAKCAAGRPRDWDFAEEALRARLVRIEVLIERLDDMPVSTTECNHIRLMLTGLEARINANG